MFIVGHKINIHMLGHWRKELDCGHIEILDCILGIIWTALYYSH